MRFMGTIKKAGPNVVVPVIRDTTVGTSSSTNATSGTLEPGLVSGWGVGDLNFEIVVGRPSSDVSLDEPDAAAWTRQARLYSELGTYDLSIENFYRTLQSGDSAPTITVNSSYGAGGAARGALAVCFHIVVGTFDATTSTTWVDASAVTSSAAAAATFTPTGLTTTHANAMVISCVGTADNNTLALNSGNEQGFTLLHQENTTTGSDMALGIAYKVVPSTGAVTCPTWEQTALGNDDWVGLTFSIAPPDP